MSAQAFTQDYHHRVFVHVFLFLSPYVIPAVLLGLEDEFCLVLIRLRPGLVEDFHGYMFCCYHNSRFKKLPKMVKYDILLSEVSYNVALMRSNQSEYATGFQTATF